jgi:pyruvate,water dikinase
LAKNNIVSNFSGVEAEKVLKNELGTIDYSKAEKLVGSIAQKGLVQGEVRLIISEHEVHKLLDGEILVASMTDPDMISAMKKAGAIVTDEGGITCHAAIVARELKKPCIIGTKIATKVLKDGDYVEVDANSGVVKILKRAK